MDDDDVWDGVGEGEGESSFFFLRCFPSRVAMVSMTRRREESSSTAWLLLLSIRDESSGLVVVKLPEDTVCRDDTCRMVRKTTSMTNGNADKALGSRRRRCSCNAGNSYDQLQHLLMVQNSLSTWI